MHVGASELLCRHVLPGRGLHERRPADEDRPRAPHDHGLVRHGGDIGAACSAGAHDDCDLGDAERRHARLVEEDAAEVVAIREDLGLEGKERTARVDEIDAGEAVLLGDLLCAEVLLHGQWEVGAAFHCGVVRNDDALAALDDPDPRDDARSGRGPVVQFPGGEG